MSTTPDCGSNSSMDVFGNTSNGWILMEQQEYIWVLATRGVA